MRSLLYKWLHKFRKIPSLAAIANKEEGQMLIAAALDDSIKQVTVHGSTYNLLSTTEPTDYAYATDDELDIIFNFVDWMLLNEQFLSVDNMLAALRINKMPTVLIIAFLTITAAAKNRLSNRNDFFEHAKTFIMGREGREKTKRLLDGLE